MYFYTDNTMLVQNLKCLWFISYQMIPLILNIIISIFRQRGGVPKLYSSFYPILLHTTQICAVMPENNETVYWMFSTSDIKLLKYRWFLTSALVLVKVNFDKLFRSSRFSSFVNTDWFKENSARKSSYAKCIKKRGTKLKNGKSLLMIWRIYPINKSKLYTSSRKVLCQVILFCNFVLICLMYAHRLHCKK